MGIKKYKKILLIVVISFFASLNITNVKALNLVRSFDAVTKYEYVAGSQMFGGRSMTTRESYSVSGFYYGNGCESNKGCVAYSMSSSSTENIESISMFKKPYSTNQKTETINEQYYCYISGNNNNLHGGNIPVQDIVEFLYNVTRERVHDYYADNLECINDLNDRKISINEGIFQCNNKSYDFSTYEGFCRYVKEYYKASNFDAFSDTDYDAMKFGDTAIGVYANSCFTGKKLNYLVCNLSDEDKQFISSEKEMVFKSGAADDIYNNSINYINKLYDLYSNTDILNKTYYTCAYIEGSSMVIDGSYETKDDALYGCYGKRKMYTILKRTISIENKSIEYPKSDSAYYSCTWTKGSSDTGTTYEQGFSNSISFKSNSFKFSGGKNIGTLNVNVKYSFDEVADLLNNQQQSSLLESVKNNIYTEDPFSGCKFAATVLKIVPIVIAIGSVAATIATGGTAGAVLGTLARALPSTAIWMTAGFVLDNICSGVDALKQTTGMFDGVLYFAYGTNPESKPTIEGVSCITSDKPKDDSPIDHNFDVTCESIMDGNFGKIVRTIMNIIRLVGIALLVLFGAFDFIKPIVSGDQDELQKSGGKFVKRLIIFVLILFVPAIIELLLSLIGRSCNTGL